MHCEALGVPIVHHLRQEQPRRGGEEEPRSTLNQLVAQFGQGLVASAGAVSIFAVVVVAVLSKRRVPSFEMACEVDGRALSGAALATAVASPLLVFAFLPLAISVPLPLVLLSLVVRAAVCVVGGILFSPI